jgi:hypothetical protein
LGPQAPPPIITILNCLSIFVTLLPPVIYL